VLCDQWIPTERSSAIKWGLTALCTCAMAIALVSSVALATIEVDGDYEGDADGGWTYTSASAYAYGACSSDGASGEGWSMKWTTEQGVCSYSLYAYSYAEVVPLSVEGAVATPNWMLRALELPRNPLLFVLIL
jgi:hypothetical protein